MTGVPQPYVLGRPYTLEQPLDMEDARDGARRFAEQRKDARLFLERGYSDLAEKENAYRKSKAQAWVMAKAVEGTAAEKEAKVDELTADLRRDRDIAKGMVEAAKELLEEIDATRASFHKLVDWSSRIDPAAQEDRSTLNHEQVAEGILKHFPGSREIAGDAA